MITGYEKQAFNHPCYNEEKTLREVTVSVLAIANEGLDVEAVIVDDCSKDGSLKGRSTSPA